MPTTKLNLPLISGNMSADVPRDLNALAQRIDDLAGVPGGHALLDENGKVIGMADMIARNVQVEDPKNIFAGANVEVVLEELFTNADNAQRAVAGVIGAPTVPGDPFVKIRQDLQDRKRELRNGLLRLKVSATEAESLKSLVDKVNAAPVGKRSVYGEMSGEDYYGTNGNLQTRFRVRGLPFRPSIVMTRRTGGSSNPNDGSFSIISRDIVSNNSDSEETDIGRGYHLYNDGFDLIVPHNSSAARRVYQAIE